MNVAEISERMAKNAEHYAKKLLPGGKVRGNYYCCANVRGGDGESLKVNLSGDKAGKWADYASNEDYGDLVDLWCIAYNLDLSDALKEIRKDLGIPEDPEFAPSRKKPKPIQPKGNPVKGSVVHQWLNGRRISDDTIREFGIRIDNGNAVFPYKRNGAVMMEKTCPPKDGKKEWFSNKDPHYILFGWQALAKDARSVVITEGEIDAMSYHESGFSALSIPQGAGTGGKLAWLENEYDQLDRFETIFLSMDMDGPGQDTVPELVDRLGRFRCRVVELPKKDANDCLKAGIDLAPYIDKAHTLDPKELKNSGLYEQDVYDEFHGTQSETLGVKLPWSKTWGDVRLRRGEMSIWAGINGHGKTNVLTQTAICGGYQGERWCIASMETLPRKLLAVMHRQAGAVSKPSPELIHDISVWFSDWLWIFAQTGTAKCERILEVFEYARRRYGITHFIVDSLAKTGIAEDDYRKQKWFVDTLGDFARDHDCHVHLVAHSRKHEDESKTPRKMDVKGTGAITDMVDNVFTVWRNKQKEDNLSHVDFDNPTDEHQAVIDKWMGRPDALLTCDKQRNHDWEGKIHLWYDIETHQFLERDGERPVDYIERARYGTRDA